ncbi:hypothetical protein ACFY36_18765 [Actinoplanes sp. NPDC000266]
MRKSQARTGSRRMRAGLAAALTTVAVVGGAGTAAFAADEAVTLAQTTVPSGGAATVTLNGTGVFTGNFYARWVFSTATCALTYPAVSTSSTAPVVDGGQITAANDTNSATLTTPALTAAKEWKVCLYVSNAANSSAIAGHSTNTAYSVPYAALSQAAGPTAGGNTITLTGTGFLPSTGTVATTFNTATCPNKYTATGTTNIAATSTRTAAGTATITVPNTIAARTPYNVCVYNGTTVGTSVLMGKSTGTYTGLATGTLSPTAGNSGGTNTITLSAPTNTISGTDPAATFTTGTCPNEYGIGSGAEPFASPLVTKISSAKVAIEVPTGVTVAQDAATTPYKVCLYASNAGTLITIPPTYTVAPTLEVSAAAIADGITGGPAQGGTRITITGLQGIPQAPGALLTAALGNAQLTDIEVIDDTSFSGTTSARGAGAVGLTVTTAAGTDASTGNIFTYSYGITITPNVAAPGATPTIDVMGAGFLALASNFSNYPGGTTANSRVLLVNNAWYAARPAETTVLATAAPTTQCKNVTVISDNELICQLDLANTLTVGGTVSAGNVPQGAYQLVVANVGTGLAAGNYSIISSGSTFTVATF